MSRVLYEIITGIDLELSNKPREGWLLCLVPHSSNPDRLTLKYMSYESIEGYKRGLKITPIGYCVNDNTIADLQLSKRDTSYQNIDQSEIDRRKGPKIYYSSFDDGTINTSRMISSDSNHDLEYKINDLYTNYNHCLNTLMDSVENAILPGFMGRSYLRAIDKSIKMRSIDLSHDVYEDQGSVDDGVMRLLVRNRIIPYVPAVGEVMDYINRVKGLPRKRSAKKYINYLTESPVVAIVGGRSGIVSLSDTIWTSTGCEGPDSQYAIDRDGYAVLFGRNDRLKSLRFFKVYGTL